MSRSTPAEIWLLDDTDHWHAVSRASVGHWGQAGFQGFYSSAGLFAALHHSQTPPICILMDFYIGHERGDVVTAQLLDEFSEDLRIIGYSTASYGSQAIVSQGGYDLVRKHNDARGLNPSLLAWLNQHENRLLASAKR